eukprot:10997035-Alexandrium_andersonii.AAC.1
METVTDVDAALVHFGRSSGVSRSRLERAHAATECVLPQVRGKLAWARAVLRAWSRQAPPKHAAPLPWRGALVLSWHLACLG